MIAFIVGGTQTSGLIGHDIAYGLLMWAIVVALEALAWFLAPRVVKFYRWDRQEWWNYNEGSVPEVWPKQLGDFVDY